MHLPETGPPLRDAIAATRRKVVDAYHRIVLFDYLPRIVGVEAMKAVAEQILLNKSLCQKMHRKLRAALLPMLEALPDGVPIEGGKWSRAPEDIEAYLHKLVAIPVEFSHAVFRLGHTQLRDSYRLSDAHAHPLFRTGPTAAGAAFDLRGNQPLVPELQVEWKYFFGKTASHGRPLDANLPASIFRLPPPSIGEPPISLAERNIRRGVDFGLPSGQEAARILSGTYGEIVPLTAGELLPETVTTPFPELISIDAALTVVTPLWFYMLRESAVKVPGEAHLGPVGGLIVAETILGALAIGEGVETVKPVADVAFADAVTAARSTAKVPEAADIRTMVQLINFLGESIEAEAKGRKILERPKRPERGAAGAHG